MRNGNGLEIQFTEFHSKASMKFQSFKVQFNPADIQSILTIHDVHHDRCRVSVRRRTSVFARVIDGHVPDQQIVGEGLSVLGELRQPRLRLKAQHLQRPSSDLANQRIKLINHLVLKMPERVARCIGREFNDTREINCGSLRRR